jgi:hypothetical protein
LRRLVRDRSRGRLDLVAFVPHRDLVTFAARIANEDHSWPRVIGP